jgi:hypothetical protein
VNAVHIYRGVKIRGKLYMYRIGFEDKEIELRDVSLARSISGLSFKCYFLPDENAMLVFICIMERIFVI